MSSAPLDPFEWMRLPQTRAASERAQRAVRREGGKAIRADARIAALEGALERSMAMNLALWELIKGKLKLSPADLESMLAQVDLHSASGEAEADRACAACGRSNRVRRVRCFYCGDFSAPPEESEFTASWTDSESRQVGAAEEEKAADTKGQSAGAEKKS